MELGDLQLMLLNTPLIQEGRNPRYNGIGWFTINLAGGVLQ